MRGLRKLLPAVLVAIPFLASPVRAQTDPELARALDRLALENGVTRGQFRVDPSALDLETTVAGRLRLTTYLLREPLRAPGSLESLARHLADPAGMEPRLELLAGLARVEGSASAGMVTTPPDTLKPEHEMEQAMEAAFENSGRRFQGKERDRVLRDVRSLPAPLTRITAELLLEVVRSSRDRDEVVKASEFKQGGAFDRGSRRTAERLREFLSGYGRSASGDDPKVRETVTALESVDLDALLEGARGLARVLDGMAGMTAADLASGTLEPFAIEWETPLGRVALGGPGPNHYTGRHALVLDLGGDDRYEGCGAVSGLGAVSVVVDLGGNDAYAPADSASAAPGGAILGYAAILDLGGGRDLYRGDGWGAGFGCLGVGWIRDDGGDDTYEVQWLGMGAGVFGAGLLVDEAGSDRYRLTAVNPDFSRGCAQGFGGPSGFGVLIDRGGDDDYEALPDSAGGMRHANDGLQAQGAAAGLGQRRAGGIGLLLDVQGQDTYRTANGGLGSATGSGLGAVVDLAGNDTYQAEDRSLGFGAAAGTGILLDLDGNDTYRIHARGLGAGAELGMGLFLDQAGADAYTGSEEGLGVSLAHGAGLFFDLAGEDRYAPGPRSGAYAGDGRTGTWEAEIPGTAVLVDLEQTGPVIGPVSDPGEDPVRIEPVQGPGTARGGRYVARPKGATP